jgi:hypothetical protein
MTDTQYIQSDPGNRRANSEELAALIIRYQKSIRSFMLPNDAARMVELAKKLKAVTVSDITFTTGLFADHGDGTHVHFERVDDAETP